jgi:NAD(P)-dependent dehydrogenase (short-subunit alcohol dehydrogenase family)
LKHPLTVLITGATGDIGGALARHYAGVYWSNHLSALADVRRGLRERCARSPLQQAELIVAGLEGALRHMWRRWCAGLPAESFEAGDVESVGRGISLCR